MDLNTLASILRGQAAATSTIKLDSSVFSEDAVRTAIRSAFALEAGKDLTISDVPSVPDPKDGVLTISAGKASVFKREVRMNLTFTSVNDGLQAIIIAEMPEKWTFNDSFKGLDRFPFNGIEISNARFVYTTEEQSEYAWPLDKSTKIELQEGLNFLSDVTFKHAATLQKLSKLIVGEWSATLKFYGPFAPADRQIFPVGKLRAPLATGTVAIGVDPIQLKLEKPAFAIAIGKETKEVPLQPIDLLVEAEFGHVLAAGIAIPVKGGSFELTATPLPGKSVDDVMKNLPGIGNVRSFIPAELSEVFTRIGLNHFSMIVAPDMKVQQVGASIGTLEPWHVIRDGVLSLRQLNLRVETIDPAGLNWTRVHITAVSTFLKEIFPGDFEFTVELEKQTSWEVTTVSGVYHRTVKLKDLVAGIFRSHDSVPAALKEIEFSDFGLSATRENKEDPFTYSFYGSVEVSFPILDTHLASALSIAVTKKGTTHTINLRGGLTIGAQVFSVFLNLGDKNSKLEASWENRGTPLGFGDIASALGWHSMPALPEGLDLALTKVNFTYDFKKKTVVLSAESANYGQMIFASFTSDEKRIHVFSIDVPLKLKFSEAPLVGDSLRIDPPVGIDNLQLIVASEAIESTADVDALESLIPKTLTKGITLAANVEMSGPHEIVLPLTGKKEEKALRSAATSEEIALRDTAPTTTYKAEPKWVNLKKTLGPVTFDKIGVQYQEGTLRFLLNAALSAAGLTLSVDGLSVGSSLKKFEPKFALRGLGIEYKAGDIEIGGAFLRTGEERYEGAALIKTSQFTLSAIGSYAKTKEEDLSLFIYAFLDYPLGGPSFFFITGLAAGFGYNRRLIAPSIDEVANFPLITQAISKKKPDNLTAALNALQAYIPPASGSIFLAVGVKFNSFKLVDSFALLTIEFGNNLVINLLGISTAIVPTPDPKATEKVTPLAQVQIAWKASFDPAEGCLGIDARLTPNSYILSKDCRLSGGFAFYSWFTGPHAGDFVQTLGGYHPDFDIPKHYPRVPRLAFDWRVSSSLTIQGNAYYALTGSALMAGGHLEVLYRQGELRAWLKVGADFLIAWKPYHYDARIYVNVGASYTFDINLLFTRIRATISVDVGAHLHLWGPDFSGTARIDLSVISFTIAFGAGASQTPQPLNWSSFAKSFLPEENVCSISLKDGLVKKIEVAKEERWVVNPKELSLVVDSAVPFKSATLTVAPAKDLITQSVKFGVGPMDVDADKLKSKVIVSVKKGDENADDDFSYTIVRKTVPRGLWGEKAAAKLKSADQFIQHVAAGIEITPAKRPDAGATSTIDLEFSDSFYPKGGKTASGSAYHWERNTSFAPKVMKPAGRRRIIEESIESNPQRDSLLADLGMKVTINIKGNVAGEFLDAPQIGTLEIVRAET